MKNSSIKSTAIFYKIAILTLIIAIFGALGLLVVNLYTPIPETATPRTATERLIFDAMLAVKTAPDSVDARLNLVSAMAGAGNHGEALKQVKVVEKMDPENTRLALLKGAIYRELGDSEEAIKWYKQAVSDEDQLSDFYVQAYTDLAEIYEDLGRYKKAIDANDSAIKYFPVSAPHFQNLGRLYEKMGQTQEALDAYVAASSFDTKDLGTIEAIKRLKAKLAKKKESKGK